ncbi:transcriptional regulator, XRE family [Segniliparus rotundus DSM 44985]|uniref:Transcriptional regulator, XRE family n=1 Tax=Segniliparus rotundus (strain ATCC BAA-972 / CDC 1076 / CIP 108378 / DSM 44985 / JCM 13578) TaxID=640132 RepID=D6Z7L5_SEGRD|nr:helix-turn-helix transcriptional regulator [Segniliparus rotundus]ADG97945.1 transcriptional regulator, XRE family [Segniliparus rotundus DSM 44985]
MGREVKEIWDIREIGDVGEYIRTQRELAQVSLRQLAQRAGVSNPYLSQIERGLRNPSAQVMGQIAKALRLSAQAIDTQAEVLGPCQGFTPASEVRVQWGARESGGQNASAPVRADRGPNVVRAAVLADGSITERQKEALIQVYEAFVQESLRTRGLDDQTTDQIEGDCHGRAEDGLES